MHASNSLLIRHFPPSMSPVDKTGFLRSFGAVDVRVMSTVGQLKHCAFATWPDPFLAQKALRDLHQYILLNRRLVAVFANEGDKGNFAVAEISPPVTQKPLEKDDFTRELERQKESFLEQLQSLAPKLNISTPVPSHVPYTYPPANPAIVQNIAAQLMANPPFYIQVLHLMNRMNLRPPFNVAHLESGTGKETQTVPAPVASISADLAESLVDRIEVEDMSESESEWESDEADRPAPPHKISKAVIDHDLAMVARRKQMKTALKSAKRMSIKAQRAKKRKVDSREVFEVVDCKKVPPTAILVQTETIQLPPVKPYTSEAADGFGLLLPRKGPSEPDTETAENSTINLRLISVEEIRENRLSELEKSTNHLFKEYSEGQPSSRLYVKNIAKKASEADLQMIFGNFCNPNDEAFDVKLLNKGRMKGQAFISLGSMENARRALRTTNGYLLHDKPIVVSFARSHAQKAE